MSSGSIYSDEIQNAQLVNMFKCEHVHEHRQNALSIRLTNTFVSNTTCLVHSYGVPTKMRVLVGWKSFGSLVGNIFHSYRLNRTSWEGRAIRTAKELMTNNKYFDASSHFLFAGCVRVFIGFIHGSLHLWKSLSTISRMYDNC